ncbi:AAA family ATPase [Ectothiorhodospira sp. B14B]|nr:AAA family ATPase [Ectothiorhodospira lacustris]
MRARRKTPIRIAVVGKGGVGKTTVAGALARVLAGHGLHVLAVDADPDANLASVLPLDSEYRPVPLAQRRDLIQEASGRSTLPEGLFLINPDTGDLLPKGTVTWGDGNPLVALGWGKGGGEGCYCAEHAVLRRLLYEAGSLAADVTVIDSEAGLEHLSRGTIAAVDLVLVVVEPGQRSVETAVTVRKLANDLGIDRVYPIVSGYKDAAELETVRSWLGPWVPVAAFPYDERIRTADLRGVPPLLGGDFLAAAIGLAAYIQGLPSSSATVST